MNIITEPVEEYLDGLYHPLNPFLSELRKSCEGEWIPVILKDAEGLILQLLRLYQPKRILEIGTAVGYSAICFSTVCPEAQIVTLELSERSAQMAERNIEKAGLKNRIRLICGDGRETLRKLRDQGEEAYDFLFIDAAKGHYREFWDACLPLLKEGSLVVSDNVLFKGMTASDHFIPERRQKTITNRMREYLRYLTETDGLQTAVLPVGDGIAVTILNRCHANEKERVTI